MAKKVTGHHEFSTWVARASPEWAQILAVRSALRVLPAVLISSDVDLCAAALRAALISWSICCVRGEKAIGANSGRAAAHARAHSISYRSGAAEVAARCTAYAAAGDPYSAAANAATYAEDAIRLLGIDSSALWSELSADIASLEGSRESGRKAALELTSAPLWRNEERPEWSVRLEADMASALSTRDANGNVWSDWYARRVAGSANAFGLPPSEDEALMLRIAGQRNAFWNRKPRDVNADIASWIEEVQSRFQPPSNPDFFISYASADEALAREVDAVAREAGYVTIAQFKDFAPGSNFIREIQRGLSDAGRLIALLSPAYEASSHCRAEWAAAYNEDPASERGKIVPFLIEATQLNPLARQVVYTSLVDLEPDERRIAILAALEHVARTRSPSEVRTDSARLASPDVVVVGGRIDAVANPATDIAVPGGRLSDLPTMLREISGAILDGLPENAPRVVSGCLDRYRRHLQERGARPIIGLLDAMETTVAREFRAIEGSFWGEGVSHLLQLFFRWHSELHGHFPRSDERERLFSETPIDEAKASGVALSEPIREATESLQAVSLEGGTTEVFDAVVTGQKQHADDLASLPLENEAQPVTIITPKRRFVLGSIGFYERVLIALGAAATVSASPAIQAAIGVITATIEKLLAFLI